MKHKIKLQYIFVLNIYYGQFILFSTYFMSNTLFLNIGVFEIIIK